LSHFEFLENLSMPAKYLIRLDDACSTCNLSKWNAIEKILDDFDVAPIVAVVPENKDPNLVNDDENPDFWSMVKRWQGKDWSIAMHGYQHTYHYVDRRKLLFPFYDRSEFGGLTVEEQRLKINNSLGIFRKNKIEPTLWVAPGHSFDELTLSALAYEVPFRTISDGIAFAPYMYEGFNFLPQQLWRVKKKSFGTWTVCLHPDTMSEQEIANFRAELAKPYMHGKCIHVNDIQFKGGRKDIFSSMFSFYFWTRWRLKNYISKLMP